MNQSEVDARVECVTYSQMAPTWNNEFEGAFSKQSSNIGIPQQIQPKLVYSQPVIKPKQNVYTMPVNTFINYPQVSYGKQISQQPPIINNQQQPRVIYPKKPNLKVAALIVTVCEKHSYDPLFTQCLQSSAPGTQTLVYQISEKHLFNIMEGFNKKSTSAVVNQIVAEIRSLEKDCVVFNWECCSEYSQGSFKNIHLVYSFIQLALNNGFMLMFSDFSLKALISHWRQDILGPKAFVIKGQCQGTVTLRFDPVQLKKSPSSQLQLLGTLSKENKCNVNTLQGTVQYSLNPQMINLKHNKYSLQVLTTARVDTQSQQFFGHTLITYPTKGRILTSMTHWIELTNIDTSNEKVFEVAKSNYGDAYVEMMRQQMKSQTNAQQQAFIQQHAQQFVMSSAPCQNSVQKTNY